MQNFGIRFQEKYNKNNCVRIYYPDGVMQASGKNGFNKFEKIF